MRKLPTLQALARLVRFANAYSVQLLSLLLTQGCSNPWARIRKRLRRSTQDNTFSTRAIYFNAGQYVFNAGQYVFNAGQYIFNAGQYIFNGRQSISVTSPNVVLSAKLKQGVEDAL